MVGKVDEYKVIRARLEDFVGLALAILCAREDVQEELCCDDRALVGGLAAVVHIDAGLTSFGRRVEELAREGVLGGVGHVVLHHEDDLFFGYTVLEGNLVGVAGIGLMAVVLEGL